MIHLDIDDISEEAIHACRGLIRNYYVSPNPPSWRERLESLKDPSRKDYEYWPLAPAIGWWCYTLVFRYHVSEEELELRMNEPVESFERVFDQLRKI